MDKSLPDKWIRKAIFDLLDEIVVDTETVYVYDTRMTGVYQPDFYIVMSSQSNLVDKWNKCEYVWDSDILLDIRTVYQRAGNTGSRLLADNILDAVRNLIKDIQLDAGSGLSIINTTLSFPNDLNEIDDSEIVFRKFLRLTMRIK